MKALELKPYTVTDKHLPHTALRQGHAAELWDAHDWDAMLRAAAVPTLRVNPPEALPSLMNRVIVK